MNATLTIRDKETHCETYVMEDHFYSYSPTAGVLLAGLTYKATLTFEFSHKGKTINQANYLKHQLDIQLKYDSTLFKETFITPKGNELTLRLKTQKEKIEEKLTVHITQKNGTIIAQFQFPIELIENIFLLSNGARGGQNNSRDDKNKDLFSKAPLLMTVNNKQEGSSRQYRVDSILTLSLQKGTEGYLFFIKASPKSASSELTVQTKWIGKSLYTIYNDGPRFGFAVRPREIDQLDRKWEKAFFDTIELVEFRKPVKFFRPAKIISFENEQIDEVYTLQVQISNEEKTNTKIIKFYMLE